MDILFAVIGVLIGGGLGFWWRGRSLVRPLPDTAVWLFPVKENSGIWKVSMETSHNWMEPEPTLWTLPEHEHSFSLEEKHALYCKDGELVDVRCLIQLTPKRDTTTLEKLLNQSSIEQLNDVSWVFQEVQSTLKTSTTLLKQETRAHWLSHVQDLETRWQSVLDSALPHWHSKVAIESITPTSDQFYDVQDPVHHALLLSRVEEKDNLQNIENRLKRIDQRIEEEKYKQAALEVEMAQTEQLDVKWNAFENHIQKKRQRIEREIQEAIEGFRTDMRSRLGLTVDTLTKELKQRTPPSDLIADATEQRNRLDTVLDTAKEEQLELLSYVEAVDDEAVEHNKEMRDGENIESNPSPDVSVNNQETTDGRTDADDASDTDV